MPLPRLVKEFLEPGCFTLEEAASVVGPSRALDTVKYLVRSGYAASVRRGLYALLPERSGASPDRYVLASKVSREGFLSHHTALELLGVAQTALFGTLYVTAPGRAAPFAFGGLTVRPVHSAGPLPGPGLVQQVRRGGVALRVAGCELALVQCVSRPDRAGGLEELMKSVEGFPRLDWDLLGLLLDPAGGRYGNASLNARLGFIVERNAERWDPPQGFLDLMERRVGRGVAYLGTTRRREGRWVPRWRLVVPRSALEGAA